MKITNNYRVGSVGYVSAYVRPLCSPRSGEPVVNQYSIILRPSCGGFGQRVFQSYGTICLKVDFDTGVLEVSPSAFGYSRTTSRYAAVFLRDEVGLTAEQVDEVKRLIKGAEFGDDCPLCIEF